MTKPDFKDIFRPYCYLLIPFYAFHNSPEICVVVLWSIYVEAAYKVCRAVQLIDSNSAKQMYSTYWIFFVLTETYLFITSKSRYLLFHTS